MLLAQQHLVFYAEVFDLSVVVFELLDEFVADLLSLAVPNLKLYLLLVVRLLRRGTLAWQQGQTILLVRGLDP